MSSAFKQNVIKVVTAIPKGKVASYGQVAAWIGHPRAARQIGGTLRSLEEHVKVPWWRVINNAGVISIKGAKHATKEIQKSLLEKEGVKVNHDFTLDIEKYRFVPDPKSINNLELE